MNLHRLLQQRAEAGRPVRVGLIGAGKFGSMFLSQVPHTPGLEVPVIVDLDPDRAREACKTVGWDPERIALLDMVLMKMGVAEFLYFETIPPKVTINEYIDLAKDYSTSQSGQFVNGILDNIHKELVQEGKMQKVDYKKA